MDEIPTEAELRGLLGEPLPRVAAKDRPTLDEIDRQWLAASPFCQVATSGPDGSCDVSPKGRPAPGATGRVPADLEAYYGVGYAAGLYPRS